MVTPPNTRAACIGATYYGPTSLRFLFGLRSFAGDASFVASGGVVLPIAPTIIGEVMTGAVGRSGLYADWPSFGPAGPYEFDVRYRLTMLNPHGAGGDRTISVFEYQSGALAGDELRALIPTTVSWTTATSALQFVVRGMKVGRIPAERAALTGFFVLSEVFYGTGPGGSTFSPTVTDHQAALLGYRWPNGPVVA
jgi:hypothetical protein